MGLGVDTLNKKQFAFLRNCILEFLKNRKLSLYQEDWTMKNRKLIDSSFKNKGHFLYYKTCVMTFSVLWFECPIYIVWDRLYPSLVQWLGISMPRLDTHIANGWCFKANQSNMMHTQHHQNANTKERIPSLSIGIIHQFGYSDKTRTDSLPSHRPCDNVAWAPRLLLTNICLHGYVWTPFYNILNNILLCIVLTQWLFTANIKVLLTIFICCDHSNTNKTPTQRERIRLCFGLVNPSDSSVIMDRFFPLEPAVCSRCLCETSLHWSWYDTIWAIQTHTPYAHSSLY